MSPFKNLDIYNLAFQISVDIYHLSMKLHNPEKFETGGQIRRSSQSIKDNIAEGYGRRRYKADFIKFLVYSHSSLFESTSQSEFLHKIYPKMGWDEIAIQLNTLEIKIANYILYIQNN